MGQVFAIALFATYPGHETEALATLRELSAALAKKGYSRDLLYRDGNAVGHYVLLRYWSSEDAKRAAQEDPEIQKFWARLGHLISIERVVETLEEVRQDFEG
jgi:quinol monooxygenase YgiN